MLHGVPQSKQPSRARVTAVSRKSGIKDKPNEDAYSISSDPCVVCVADGVTRLRCPDGSYPDPSPAARAAWVLACEVASVASYSCAISPEFSLRDAFEAANQRIARLREEDPVDHEHPGTIGSAVLVASDCLSFAHIGDGTILSIGPTRVPVFLSRDQTQVARARARTVCQGLDTSSVIRFMQSRLRNRPEEEGSYGVLTGEPAALAYLETGTVAIPPGIRIVVMSDGCQSLWRRAALPASGVPGRQQLLELLYEGEIEKLVALAEWAERRDGDPGDDKTLIHIVPASR